MNPITAVKVVCVLYVVVVAVVLALAKLRRRPNNLKAMYDYVAEGQKLSLVEELHKAELKRTW